MPDKTFAILRRAIANVLGSCVLLGMSTSAFADIPAPVQRALQQSDIASNGVGFAVYALDGGALVASHRAQSAMQPASTMKLLTTYAALDLLGPDYVWRTTARAAVPASDGKLRGDVYLQGSGDPSLTLERFWLLLRQLQQRLGGKIEGDLVLDRSAYALPDYDPAAFDNEPQRPYNAGADALLVNFGTVRIDLIPDPVNRRVKALLATPAERLQVNARLTLSDGACGDWREKLAVKLPADNVGGATPIELSGPFAASCGERSLHLNLNNSLAASNAQVEDLFRALWREQGGLIGGQVRSGNAPAEALPVMRWESPPLAEILRDTNKYSNNVMARQIFLSLAESLPVTPESARQRVQQWLQRKQLNFPELIIDNGSGLSRSEMIAPGHMAELLVDAWRNPLMPEFVATLPIAGVDGTLKKRFANGEALKRAHLKTGSLSGVRALAGYVQDQRGRRYALACFVNDAKAVNAVCDALADWVAARH